MNSIWRYIALLLLTACVSPAQAKPQNPDQQLLSTFCASSNIKGSTCRKAIAYPSSQACEVKLGKTRYSGKFLAGKTILVIDYASECEPHATDFGGSLIFEQAGGRIAFKGYEPGSQANDCTIVARNELQDRLICLTGHMGQGYVESGVAEMVFTQSYSGDIKISPDFFVTAADSTGAYGANKVRCKQTSQYFGLSELGAGPQRDTVVVTIAQADSEIIRTACAGGLPPPKEVFGELAPGEAYVPSDYEKNGRFVIDLLTRRIVPEADFERTLEAPAAR